MVFAYDLFAIITIINVVTVVIIIIIIITGSTALGGSWPPQ
jgi:hypothetical protein